ncbi:transcriptional repressor LexA [bacterium]|nr:transcriptional repressor LexA [candidate division CSSED10-310 bacterium]
MNLTQRQKEIYDFIKSYLSRNGIAPTVTEIQSFFKLRSVATVHKHLTALENRECIRRSKNRARAIELISIKPSESLYVPLLGLIAAGEPIAAIENPDTLSIPEDMIGRTETYALKVKGNSMIEDGIHEGDHIIIEKRSEALDGEIVVALIDSEEATVKRFYREGSMIKLQPANRDMDPLYIKADRIVIQGVVIGLIRKYRR